METCVTEGNVEMLDNAGSRGLDDENFPPSTTPTRNLDDQISRSASVVTGTRWSASSRFAWTLLLSAVTLCPIFQRPHASAQEIAPVQMDLPILPEGMLNQAPVVSSQMPSVPVGTSVSPQVMQANFSGCMSCGSVGCSGCDFEVPGFACPPSSIGLWVRADYLVWYEKEADVIPMLTTSSGFTADPGQLLTLDAPETRVIFGGGTDDNPVDGFRIELGAWMDAAHTYGIMGRYFEVGDRQVEFQAGADDFTFLGIPFANTDIGGATGNGQGPGEDAVDLTVPGERRGQASVRISGDVRSWEVLFRRLSETGCNYRRDWVYGYRNFTLDETLNLTASLLVTNPPVGSIVPAGTLTEIEDQFDIENRFHGLDLGMTGHFHQGPWSMDYMAKVALGVMTSEMDINGSILSTIPVLDNDGNVISNATDRREGGLFSQESNIGSHDESKFAVIPELNVNIGYGVTPNLDLTVGYSFIWVSSITRAGTMDRSVDEGLFFDLDPINGNRPQPDFNTDSYFLHGLNVGMTGRF